MDVDSLSLRERAAQLLFPRVGSNMPPPVAASDDVDRIEALCARCPIGGLIVFNGRREDTTQALIRLQQRSRVPLLVCADMERGAGQVLEGATEFPHAMAYASMGEDGEELLRSSARVQAREALGSGIQATFAPDADVNRNSRNPIIATRAFSSDPTEAARLVRAFIRTCREEGLLCTAKHFPGHGNTTRDSHAELPVVESTREDLDAFDLIPFRAAVDEGVDLVMSAHVVFPALDPDRPATLSPIVLRDLLRDELGFEGAVVSDSLLMGAIRESHSDAGEQAAALVRAGIDILLDVPDPDVAANGIVRAVESGRMERRVLDEAVARVLALKRRLADRFGGAVFTDPYSVVGPDENGRELGRAVADRAARRAVLVVHDPDGRLPVDPNDAAGGGVVALLVKPHRTHLDPVEEPFGQLIREALPGARFWQIGPREDADTYEAILAAVQKARWAVAALVVKPAAWHAFGLHPKQDELVTQVLRHVPTVVASLGSPYVLDRYEQASARLCTFSDVEASQRALVDRLVAR